MDQSCPSINFTLRASDSAAKPSRFTRRTSESEPGAVWLHLAGRLDQAAAPWLTRALRAALDSAHLVVVDARDLEIVDRDGTVALIDATTRARRRRQRRRLVVVYGATGADAPVLRDGDVELLDLPWWSACRVVGSHVSSRRCWTVAVVAR